MKAKYLAVSAPLEQETEAQKKIAFDGGAVNSPKSNDATTTDEMNKYLYEFDDEFDNFFINLKGRLTYEEMEEVFPVYLYTPPIEKGDLYYVEVGANWGLHSGYYIASIVWFVELYIKNGPEFMAQFFQTLTPVQKTILQRGFDIYDFNDCLPRRGRELYANKLEMNDDIKSPFDFPVRPTKFADNRLFINESEVDMQNSRTPGQGLH
jgi:hypothetical protein